MIRHLEDYSFPKLFWCASNNWFLREETIGGVVNDKWFELFNDYFFHRFNVLPRPPDAPVSRCETMVTKVLKGDEIDLEKLSRTTYNFLESMQTWLKIGHNVVSRLI